MFNALQVWLEGFALSEAQQSTLAYLLAVTIVLALSTVAYLFSKWVFLSAANRFAERTTNDWDDALVARKVFHRISHLAPAIIIWAASPIVFVDDPDVLALVRRGLDIYIMVVAFLIVNALLNAANDIYKKFPVSGRIPIKGYLQVVQIVVGIAIGILMVSTLTERSPWALFTGLGALTAILLLIFKDSILGLVAGVQLVGNDMVRPGDWIEMPKYEADGDVIDITLNTVKVRNWDKTITTIPTYALISDSFKNWRGMTESGGRRIKRSILIDVSTVQFCTPEMLRGFEKIHRLKDYLKTKGEELDKFNRDNGIDDSVLVNGRRMTNLGTFRAYLVEYLRHHPKIHQDMTLLVRQLQPGESGLPLEVYVFSNDQAWGNYESIQADIFDHIYASLPEFGLRAFQNPAGSDVMRAGQQLGAIVSHSEEAQA